MLPINIIYHVSLYEKYSLSSCQLTWYGKIYEFLAVSKLITICNYGEGRSPEACRLLDQKGYMSYFLSCGLNGLMDLSGDYRQEIISNLKLFNGIYIFVYELERWKHDKLIKKISPQGIFQDETEFLKKVNQGKITLPT